MGKHNEFRIRIEFKSFLQSFRIHVPGIALGIDEDGFAVLIRHWVDAGIKGHVRAKNTLAL